MALARVVAFEGVDNDRIAQVREMIEEGEPPEGLPSSEIIVLHDAEAQTSLTVVIFANEEDYRRGDAVLDAMPAEGTPGRRTSVQKYDVAVRRSM